MREVESSFAWRIWNNEKPKRSDTLVHPPTATNLQVVIAKHNKSKDEADAQVIIKLL